MVGCDDDSSCVVGNCCLVASSVKTQLHGGFSGDSAVMCGKQLKKNNSTLPSNVEAAKWLNVSS